MMVPVARETGKGRRVKVKEIMTTRVVTVTADTPVPVIAGLLRDNRISGVPVIDAGGAVVGLVSEYDLLARGGETAGEVMTGSVITRQRGHRRRRRPAPAGRAADPAGPGDERPAAGRDRQPRRRGGAADHASGCARCAARPPAASTRRPGAPGATPAPAGSPCRTPAPEIEAHMETSEDPAVLRGVLPADGPDPRLRAARRRDVHPRQDRRVLPPQPRARRPRWSG